MSDQFNIVNHDILGVDDLSKFSMTALLAVLVEIEHTHPGTLAYVVRLAALAADNWQFTTKSGNAQRSLQVQKELIDILVEVDEKTNSSANAPGGYTNEY